MRRLLPLCLVTVALAVPASLTTAFAGPAWALTGASCTKLAATAGNPSTGTLSGCSDPANTGKSGKLSSTVSGSSGTGTITWNKTGTTTTSFTFKVVTPDKCPSGAVEAKETGTVTGGSGAALKSIPKGQKTSATVCANTSKNTVTLLKGTKFVI